MIALTESATLHPLVLPARADAADADDLNSYARVRNASLIENRPMLNINEAMGFTAIAYEGAWRKDLS